MLSTRFHPYFRACDEDVPAINLRQVSASPLSANDYQLKSYRELPQRATALVLHLIGRITPGRHSRAAATDGTATAPTWLLDLSKKMDHTMLFRMSDFLTRPIG
jgi:hypothetical protein|tara:strand:+ start:6585 stop:6896 length:312 start_codon:yes stop_codon:yes gene_type:complete